MELQLDLLSSFLIHMYVTKRKLTRAPVMKSYFITYMWWKFHLLNSKCWIVFKLVNLDTEWKEMLTDIAQHLHFEWLSISKNSLFLFQLWLPPWSLDTVLHV